MDVRQRFRHVDAPFLLSSDSDAVAVTEEGKPTFLMQQRLLIWWSMFVYRCCHGRRLHWQRFWRQRRCGTLGCRQPDPPRSPTSARRRHSQTTTIVKWWLECQWWWRWRCVAVSGARAHTAFVTYFYYYDLLLTYYALIFCICVMMLCSLIIIIIIITPTISNAP